MILYKARNPLTLTWLCTGQQSPLDGIHYKYNFIQSVFLQGFSVDHVEKCRTNF